MPFRRRSDQVAPTVVPRDVEALEQVLIALDGGVEDEQDARVKMTDTLVRALGVDYGAQWAPVAGGLELAYEAGPVASRLTPESRGSRGTLAEAAWRTRRPQVFSPGDTPPTTRSARRIAAEGVGTVAMAAIPMTDGDEVVGVLEFWSARCLPRFADEKWQAIGRIATLARRQALAAASLQETLNDREAVTTVVTRVGEARDEESAIRVALETVRTAFGWAYGSYWVLDEDARVLRFALESGSAGADFRKVTLEASFAEGVGLSGRAWKGRDLVFVRDLGEMTDCVRAPVAQRAGVRSGVCFPILDDGRVIGTMDFFTTDTIELSPSRGAALRNVAQLVSQRLSVVRRSAADARNAQMLLDTVAQLRGAAGDAGRVADEAVGRSATMRDEVAALNDASTAIGDVIKVITGIAQQTNLLALNATIEAARAGEVGRGFAVVANEVKELAGETAAATQRVAGQIAGIQASSQSVASGIHATSEIVGQLDAVQQRINDVLEQQAAMAELFERA
ncbi:methyl-accepting chemotaxis protein [Cellulomonas marina]|uniref:GAF domain-containing protein n=1 Tax=Cellulomonas marina TaxID=988821 RepID=A0A1I0Y339_9CELL|nr:methyl-accepting chemotaxis protein [Cellulomonas marina]GIG28391.1 hypothetical protein Cma02nite_09910 [Cellulomonas marina]SFB07297.1 GAF domain-containing protein [Cellulomonas marina]